MRFGINTSANSTPNFSKHWLRTRTNQAQPSTSLTLEWSSRGSATSSLLCARLRRLTTWTTTRARLHPVRAPQEARRRSRILLTAERQKVINTLIHYRRIGLLPPPPQHLGNILARPFVKPQHPLTVATFENGCPTVDRITSTLLNRPCII